MQTVNKSANTIEEGFEFSKRGFHNPRLQKNLSTMKI